MRIHKQLYLMIAVLAPLSAFAADGHFSLPPNSPANNPVAGNFGKGGTNDRAPDGCDGGTFLAWAKAWRQRARDGYVRGVAQYLPSLASGAHCIKSPEAYDVQYIPNGDYWVASCLAAKNGTLSHFFEMDINVPFDTACLGDSVFTDYVKGNQCKMPGGNQKFLDTVMKPCAITPPNSPILRNPPRATAIDPSYWARLLNDRPELKTIVDETTRRVKVGGSGGTGGGGNGCGDNPFLCDPPKDVDGNSRDVK